MGGLPDEKQRDIDSFGLHPDYLRTVHVQIVENKARPMEASDP